MSYFQAKCTRFDFGWGSAPYPAGGTHRASPDPLTGFEGVLLLREGNGREGKGKGRKGKEGKGESCVMAFRGMDAPVPTMSKAELKSSRTRGTSWPLSTARTISLCTMRTAVSVEW